MKRLTTNSINGIFDRVTNCCTIEDGQAVLHFNSGDVPLARYVAEEARKKGCNVTEIEVFEGDECLDCECPIAILNNLGVQAAENNQRLKEIEDILCGEGDDYDLERLKVIVNQCMSMRKEVNERFGLTKYIPVDELKELVEAYKDGRCLIMSEEQKRFAEEMTKNGMFGGKGGCDR